MTTVTYSLGRPRAAASRGGDCRARDLDQGRNVHGPHRFAATTHCQISNGMLRLTVSAAGTTPALTVEARRGAIIVGDVYDDVYSDVYGGSVATPAWFALGTLIIDSSVATALLTAARLVHVNPEAVIIRLVAPAIGDAFVVLERGVPAVVVQHGDSRADPLVSTTRRLRWTGEGEPVGAAQTNRVQETGGTQGLSRFVAGLDPVATDAGAFSVVTAATTTARLGAGVGTYDDWSHASALHFQLADASRPQIVVAS